MRAWGPEGRESSPRRLRGPPAADSAALPGDAAGWRPGASKEAPSPARRHPAGLGRAPGAEGPRDSGAGLTHEEAEEIEADEQRPLAAALPRVVVERRAAPVLALRDDRLVVLVVLHGAGCGASLLTREDAPRQQPHTQTLGSPPGRSCLGERRVGTGLGRGKSAISLPSSNCRRWCSLLTPCTSAFFPLSTQNRSKVQGGESQIPSRNFCKAALLGTRWARVCLSARARVGSAAAPPPSSAAGDLMNGSCAEPSHSRAPAPTPTFPPPPPVAAVGAAAAAAVVIALGLFSALLFHEVL